MNESDLASNWEEKELDLLKEYELKKDALTYKEEVEIEWNLISNALA